VETGSGAETAGRQEARSRSERRNVRNLFIMNRISALIVIAPEPIEYQNPCTYRIARGVCDQVRKFENFVNIDI
jgi:hypothetical protein